ncbi:E3 ubiquitin-protein ligase Siah2-like [Pollicipes pollicipes]|uniref:E3 ubiquitin-protein ligase Siah2-like n=1 Tax=Pollicipes pollicipes TaxID=41117 RepID=UPI00188507B2|nr:E3 ubiquitin-protein ligase Siah2-like [Pollicipes pollicipes]XP_037072606.1 E3 ubiquitin-protein ligase Siah2-like [Pollicipes pollicipes]
MAQQGDGGGGSPPAAAPQPTSPVDYPALLRLFQCPVCNDYLRPPIPQCKKGHTMCEKCRPAVKGICPLCKQAVANQTNIMMEKMCALIKFPCGHAGKGCAELVPLREKPHHEAVCDFRPIHCEYARNGCGTVLCLLEMPGHVRQCHFRPH